MVAGGGTVASGPTPAIGGNGGCTSIGASTSNIPGTMSMSVTVQRQTDGTPSKPKSSENRRSNKPIMEKRRRARINNCLNVLKTLILDAMKKDPARHSKLEKADILEMTVKHLEGLQRQQVAMTAASDPSVANKFRAGFTECAGEVGRFPGLDGSVKRRLLQHLANCLNSTNPPETPLESTHANNPPLQVHILRTPTQAETPVVQQTNPSNIILANTSGQGVQLVPTRLPNGDIAFILPSSNSTRRTAAPSTPSSSPSPSMSSTSSNSSPLPVLIPMPSTNGSNSPSPVTIDRLQVNSTSPRQITIVTTQTPQRVFIPQRTTGKNVPLVAYQYNEDNEKVEHVIQQRLLIPDSNAKSENVINSYNDVPVMHGLEPAIIKTRKNVVPSVNNYTGNCESPLAEDIVYERNQLIVTHDGQVIENEHSTGYVSDNVYGPDRETLLHIPEREYYDSGMQSVSPRSPVGYIEGLDYHKYTDYYRDPFDRSYSPEMPKPLALVTKKKCEEYDSEERPWRPW